MIEHLFRKLFSNKEADDIFGQEATGEICQVCKKCMFTKQKIIKVASGEKMHSECWPKFFEMRIGVLKAKYTGTIDG